MATVSMSGQDTIILNNRVFNDLAEGNVVEITFPTDIANIKTGKNGNSIYGLNETGRQCELKMRLIRGSSDDKFMQGLLNQQQLDFSTFPLMIGQFIKKLGDGSGAQTSDQYLLSGGIFSKQVDGKSNVEGEVDQSVSMYTMKFSNAPRVLT